MPFAELDYYREGPLTPIRHATAVELGVNLRLTPSVVLKGQYTRAEIHFAQAVQLLSELRFQIAWSF